MKNELTISAHYLKDLLLERGHSVKESVCLEAVSRIKSGYCYNVAKNTATQFLESGQQLTRMELDKLPDGLNIVVPVPLSVIGKGIEAINDLVSELITGSECGLSNIGFSVYPYFYDEDTVAMLVYGHVDYDFLDKDEENEE